MEKFDPPERLIQISYLEAFDAIGEFIHLHFEGSVDESRGLSNLLNDIYRGFEGGGFPADESTWSLWVEACERTKLKHSGGG